MAEKAKKAKKAKKDQVEGNTDIFQSIRSVLGAGGSVPDLQSEDCFYAYTHGIPIRNYPVLCRLLGTDVLPLSRAFTIVGTEETMKSSMGWFIVKLFLNAGGFCHFIDTEHKTAWPFVDSILDLSWDPHRDKTHRIFWFKAPTRDAAQDYMITVLKNYDEQDKIMSGGNKAPMVILYDSLKAGESKSIMEAKEQGVEDPGYDYMHAATRLQRTLNVAIGGYIQEKPILFLGINHSVPNKNPGAKGGTTEAGGSFKDFAWSGSLQMMKSSVGQVQGAVRNSTTVKMKMKKSSLNEKQGIALPIQVETRVNEFDELSTRFLWDKCLAMMLENAEWFPKARSSKYLSVCKKDKNNYYCNALGIDADHSVPPQVIGGILANSPKWQEILLRHVFHIDPAGILDNGVIYKPVPYNKDIVKETGTLNGMEVKYVREPPHRTVVDNFWPQECWAKNNQEDDGQDEEDVKRVVQEIEKPDSDKTVKEKTSGEESSGTQ